MSNIRVFEFKIIFLDADEYECDRDNYTAQVDDPGFEGGARDLAGDLADEYAKGQMFHYDAESFETILVDAG
jgi:hypothetical protein